jgi:hypothetical protein
MYLRLQIGFVTIRYSLHFIFVCWGYTLLRRTKLVSGETRVMVLHSSYKNRDSGKYGTGTERERE